MKIVFIGTSEFSKIILEKMVQAGYQPNFVITSPDKPVGRKQIITPSPVKKLAKEHKIRVLQKEKPKDHLPEIKSLKPDLGVIVSYGKIIPLEILNIPKHGFINIHPSLLPKYRGSSPIQTTILNGTKETGITIIKATEKVDSGPIVAIEKLKDEIHNISYIELHDKLAYLAANVLIKTILDLTQNKIKFKIQDDLKATYTKILKKEDGKMDWQKSALDLERQIRAYFPWPGSYTFWNKKDKKIKVKILKAKVLKDSNQSKEIIGLVLTTSQNQTAVICKKDLLIIEKLQIEGKKEIKIQDFLRGYSDFIGSILG